MATLDMPLVNLTDETTDVLNQSKVIDVDTSSTSEEEEFPVPHTGQSNEERNKEHFMMPSKKIKREIERKDLASCRYPIYVNLIFMFVNISIDL